MSSDKHIIDAAEELVRALNRTLDKNLPKDIADIVKNHSAGAAAAGVASGWLPGAGALAAVGICAGFIWSMYGRINSKIGLPFAENVVKSLATGIATNLGGYFVGGMVLQTVFSIFPGIGSVGASVVAGATSYALTLASGWVYLKLLTKLFLDGKDPAKMDENSLKDIAKGVAASENLKAVISDAKAAYKQSESNAAEAPRPTVAENTVTIYCPKCGKPLGVGVTRCWTRGCDYVIKA